MRNLILFLLALFLGSVIADSCEARRWWRPRRRSNGYTYTNYGYSGVTFGGTDQERCYQEAKYMHEHGIRHHIGGQIGSFEGFGVGGPNCATCTPRGGMTLTGDAHYGTIRVRSWR